MTLHLECGWVGVETQGRWGVVVADDDASRADSCRDVAGIDPDRVWLRVV